MLPTIDIGRIFNDNFWPPFLHIVIPMLILVLVFSIVRIISARLLRGQRILKALADCAIVLVFLVACALIMPEVIKTVPF